MILNVYSNFFNLTLTDFNFHKKSKSLPLLYINEYSLHKNSDDLEPILQLDQQNVNLPTESSLGNILDEHAPLKRINKYKVKFKSKL